MEPNQDLRLSATLDPADWDPVRTVGRQMVDDMVGYLETVRDRPTWQSVPAAVRAQLDEAIPREGQPLEAVYDQFRDAAGKPLYPQRPLLPGAEVQSGGATQSAPGAAYGSGSPSAP